MEFLSLSRRRLPRETSPGAKSEEKRLFSQTRTTVTLTIYATFLYNDYWGWNHRFLIENPNDSGPLKEQLTERTRIEMNLLNEEMY